MSDDPTPSGFDDLRSQFVAAARREQAESSRPPWWRRLRLPVIVAVVGLGAASVGVATYFTGSGDPLPQERRVPGAGGVEPGVLLDSAAPDPIAQAPAWVLRLSASNEGRECVELGRLKGGRFGQMTGRVFRAQPQSSGLCTRLADDPLLISVFQRRDPPRTVVYGVSRNRTPVEIRIGNARRRVVPGALGAFITVLAATPKLAGATATTTSNGKALRRPLG